MRGHFVHRAALALHLGLQIEKLVRELQTDFFFRFQANLQMKAIQ